MGSIWEVCTWTKEEDCFGKMCWYDKTVYMGDDEEEAMKIFRENFGKFGRVSLNYRGK